MQLSMIFFTIIIERKKPTPEEELASLQSREIINELQAKQVNDLSCYPSYCTRV